MGLSIPSDSLKNLRPLRPEIFFLRRRRNGANRLCRGLPEKAGTEGENLRRCPLQNPTLFFPGVGYTHTRQRATPFLNFRRRVSLEIYLDLAIFLNFLVDFLLLLGTNRLSGRPLSPGRCALGAAVGAVYSGACFLPGLAFLRGLHWRAVSLALMGAAAFGVSWNAGKRTLVFLLLSMALGGVALTLGRGDFWGLILGLCLVWLLCQVGLGGEMPAGRYVPIQLHYGDRTAEVMALRDTGNTLRDPVTGESVLIVSGKTAEKLTGLTASQLRSPLDTLARRPIPGLRLIPYRTVGQSCAMLLGLRLNQVVIDGKTRRAIVAFDPEGMESEQMALIGGMV